MNDVRDGFRALGRALLCGMVLFILSALLAQPFKELVVYFNDWNTPKPLGLSLGALVIALFAGTIWVMMYTRFKMATDDLAEVMRRPARKKVQPPADSSD